MYKKLFIEINKAMHQAIDDDLTPFQLAIDYKDRVLLLECLSIQGKLAKYYICDLPQVVLEEDPFNEKDVTDVTEQLNNFLELLEYEDDVKH